MPSCELHHIARGTSGKRLSKGKRACLLMLCNACHQECTDSKHPPARQAAIKLLADPEGFDLEVLNSCRVARIDEGDVVLAVRELLMEGVR